MSEQPEMKVFHFPTVLKFPLFFYCCQQMGQTNESPMNATHTHTDSHTETVKHKIKQKCMKIYVMADSFEITTLWLAVWP